MASLTKSIKQGKAFYRIQFTFDGTRRTLHLGNVRESAAQKIKARIEELASSAALNYRPDDETQRWVRDYDWPTIQKLVGWGITKSVSNLVEERRERMDPETKANTLTLRAFADWYTQNRAGDCEPSTVRKMKASLTQFVKYCKANETIESVDDVTEQMAFRFQLARLKNKAVATAGKDVKVIKTAFSYGMKAGKVKSNPFANLKAGSDVNEDGQQIVPVSDYEMLVNACPNSTWRAILALARLGGLRCPSELTNLRWSDVNWEAKTIRVTSPKTKRYGKTERVIPLFERLDRELSDHWEITAGKSVFVIDLEHLRRTGVSLSTRFKDICVAAGVPEIQNPFRNMRLSAANDVCRLPGVTPKTICDWFGHDMKTALKHYHKTTRQDFEQAVKSDPFLDREMARTKPERKVDDSMKCVNEKFDVKSDARTPENGKEWGSENSKTPRKASTEAHAKAIIDPCRSASEYSMVRMGLTAKAQNKVAAAE